MPFFSLQLGNGKVICGIAILWNKILNKNLLFLNIKLAMFRRVISELESIHSFTKQKFIAFSIQNSNCFIVSQNIRSVANFLKYKVLMFSNMWCSKVLSVSIPDPWSYNWAVELHSHQYFKKGLSFKFIKWKVVTIFFFF